eukprot:15339286-Ditylum_brightwellii.AAC.1
MRGEDFMSFVPLHLTATQRSATLREWISTWAPRELEYLEAESWYERGHDLMKGSYDSKNIWYPGIKPGVFVWEPAPAAASAAVEELRKARHKQHVSTHIVVIPKLMTPEWYKPLLKVADFTTEIPAGQPFWPYNCHEPLVLALCFPYLPFRPWQIRRTPAILGMER